MLDVRGEIKHVTRRSNFPRLHLGPGVRAAAVHVGLIAARLERRALGIVGHLAVRVGVGAFRGSGRDEG